VTAIISDRKLVEQYYRAWQNYGKSFWQVSKWLKTQDTERRLIRPFPVPDVRFIRVGVNDGAQVVPFLETMRRRFYVDSVLAYLKSRRTMATNTTVAFMWHEATFTEKSSDEAYLGTFSADHKEKAVRGLMRIKSFYHFLPEWMKKFNPLVKDNELHLRWQNGAEIVGYSSNPNMDRMEGPSRAVKDEFAFHPESDEAYVSVSGSNPLHFNMISTPNGKNNAFYRYCAGLIAPNPNVLKIHWSMFPDRDIAWKDWMRKEKNWTDADWQREMEFSFESMTGPAMFEYDRPLHCRKFSFDKHCRRGYRGWDIGTEYAACILGFKNSEDQLCIQMPIVEFRLSGGFRAFIRVVKEYCESLSAKFDFPDDFWTDFTPHDTTQNSTESRITYQQMFNEEGIYPEVVETRDPSIGWDAIRTLMNRRWDGRPGIIFNEDGVWLVGSPKSDHPEWRNIIIEGLQGGFQRQQRKTAEGVQFLDKPLESRPFIDCFDALRCMIVGLYPDVVEKVDGLHDRTQDSFNGTYEINQPIGL
jgi:hypothetical protein